jgi:hypothetical protein
MSSDIYPLAVRFADLWAVDHHQMVDEIYSPDVHMESMCKPAQPAIEGTEQLHALEDRLAAMIPDHRHELVRIVAEERHACLETTVMGPTTAEYAPACVWWWLGDEGKVEREVGYFDWEKRSTDSHLIHGVVPPIDLRPRGDSAWYRDFVMSTTDEWAPNVAAGERWIDVDEIAAEGSVVAVLFAYGTSRLASRGTAILTLDANDQIASLRSYWDWSKAVELNHE